MSGLLDSSTMQIKIIMNEGNLEEDVNKFLQTLSSKDKYFDKITYVPNSEGIITSVVIEYYI